MTMVAPLAVRAPMPVRRHFAYLQMRVPDQWTSFALAFGFAATGLIAETSGAKSVAVAYLSLVGLTAVLFPHFTIKANVRNLLLWLFPIWSMFSVAWSIKPDMTFHSSWLVMASLVAVCAIGATPHRRAINTAFFIVIFLFVIYSMVAGHIWQLGSGDFAGVMLGKNQFGHIAAMEILMSLGLLGWTTGRERRIARGFAVLGIIVGAAALLASHATGSLLSVCISILTFVFILTFRRLSMPFRVTIAAALLATAILYLTFGQTLEQEIVSSVMKTFNKDTTLTGRTKLWEIADRMIAKHPFIGQGASAFWSIDNPDARMIWREMGVLPNHGFTFHNTFRDIAVDVGWVGLGFYLLGLGWHFLRSVLTSLRTGRPTEAMRTAMLTYFLIRLPVETIGYGGLTMDIFLLIGFLCLPVNEATHWRTVLMPPEPKPRTPPTAIFRLPKPTRTRRPTRDRPQTPAFRTE